MMETYRIDGFQALINAITDTPAPDPEPTPDPELTPDPEEPEETPEEVTEAPKTTRKKASK